MFFITMVNYDLIKNTELRLLVASSETINSLSDEEIEVMVAQIVKLDEEGEKALIKALADERQQIWKKREEAGNLPAQQIDTLKNSMYLVSQIERDFKGEVRRYDEMKSQVSTSSGAENIINNL